MLGTGAQTNPAAWLASAVLLVSLAARAFEQLNVFHPDKADYGSPRSIGLRYDDVALTADDGPRLSAWWVPANDDGPVVLYCHGNGGNMTSRLDALKLLHDAGASVLAFDYRGFGGSSGTPTEAGTYRDGEAAYAWLVGEKKVDAKRIVFIGESLGNGVAVELALRHRPAGLVFESGFTSIVDMGRLMFPILPVRWLVRYRYDNLSKIGSMRCPVLVMHGRQDEVIPYEMGRRIYDAAPSPKAFFDFIGGHNEGFTSTPGYVEALRSFFASLPGLRTSSRSAP